MYFIYAHIYKLKQEDRKKKNLCGLTFQICLIPVKNQNGNNKAHSVLPQTGTLLRAGVVALAGVLIV
jgi:hypothetical protein